MSIGFQHPNVKVHIGDGFKFLEDRKNEFDVIITDSSDPDGPAESLFQRPFFELLHGALREGGVISTQGCSSPFTSPFCFVNQPETTLPQGRQLFPFLHRPYPSCLSYTRLVF